MPEVAPEQFVGIGVVADQLGVSASSLRKWERQGRIPTASRIAGQDRRIYRLDDLAVIRQRMSEMRAAGRQPGAGRTQL
jgi:DNA-binding transcriptional MerR regulator